MGYEKKSGQNLSADYQKMDKVALKEKKKHAHVIFNADTHRKLKMYAASIDSDVCAVLEDIAQNFLREKGRL